MTDDSDATGVYFIPDIAQAPERVRQIHERCVPMMHEVNAVLEKHGACYTEAMSTLVNLMAYGIVHHAAGSIDDELFTVIELLINGVRSIASGDEAARALKEVGRA